ncbi:unnamed protein product [Colias eurytheme]|nr:unnamed protein product [Colias eurytheme]
MNEIHQAKPKTLSPTSVKDQNLGDNGNEILMSAVNAPNELRADRRDAPCSARRDQDTATLECVLQIAIQCIFLTTKVKRYLSVRIRYLLVV